MGVALSCLKVATLLPRFKHRCHSGYPGPKCGTGTKLCMSSSMSRNYTNNLMKNTGNKFIRQILEYMATTLQVLCLFVYMCTFTRVRQVNILVWERGAETMWNPVFELKIHIRKKCTVFFGTLLPLLMQYRNGSSSIAPNIVELYRKYVVFQPTCISVLENKRKLKSTQFSRNRCSGIN